MNQLLGPQADRQAFQGCNNEPPRSPSRMFHRQRRLPHERLLNHKFRGKRRRSLRSRTARPTWYRVLGSYHLHTRRLINPQTPVTVPSSLPDIHSTTCIHRRPIRLRKGCCRVPLHRKVPPGSQRFRLRLPQSNRISRGCLTDPWVPLSPRTISSTFLGAARGRRLRGRGGGTRRRTQSPGEPAGCGTGAVASPAAAASAASAVPDARAGSGGGCAWACARHSCC